jgi:hypothetical protein
MKSVVVHGISLLDVIDFGLARSESGLVGILARCVQGPRRRRVLAHNVIRSGSSGNPLLELFSDADVELPYSRPEPVRAPTRRSRGKTETSFCQARFCRRNL